MQWSASPVDDAFAGAQNGDIVFVSLSCANSSACHHNKVQLLNDLIPYRTIQPPDLQLGSTFEFLSLLYSSIYILPVVFQQKIVFLLLKSSSRAHR